MPAQNGVIFGGPSDGAVVVVPEGQTGVDLQEPRPDPTDPKQMIMVTVRYEVPNGAGEKRLDGYGRLRLVRDPTT
jgi:hypothetical protein